MHKKFRILNLALIVILSFTFIVSNNQSNISRASKPSQSVYNTSATIEKKAKKNIIFDLGDTLFSVSRFGMAQNIGLGQFILYPLLDWKNPHEIQTIVYQVLSSLKAQSTQQLFGNDRKLLPMVMSDWLAGIESGESICKRAKFIIEQYSKLGYFVSNREKQLVEQTINVMFDPLKLAQNFCTITGAAKIVKLCTQQIDNTGKQLHNLFILSNMDSETFNYIYSLPEGQKIFKFFNLENIVVSGDIGLIKPQKSIYSYIIKKYNLNPADCIFIDDLPENILAAQQSGMTGLLFENPKVLEHQLRKLNII